jgi:hypothetical protein
MITSTVVVQEVACPYCQAPIGQPCVLASGVCKGELLGEPHSLRKYAAHQALAINQGHVITEVFEGTINPRLRCSCGDFEVTSYNAEQRAQVHLAQVVLS